MPTFVNSPFSRPILAMKGVAAYLFGSYDPRIGNTKAYLKNSALTTNVATVTVQITSGPMPVVGNLISIINSTAGAAALNVQRAIITGVTISQSTGAGTITFALTNANIASVADSGTVQIETAEVPDTLAAVASQAVMVQAPSGDSQFTIPFAVTFTTLPTAVTVTLQRALNAQNPGEWTATGAVVTVAAGAYTAGPVVEATLERAYVYRALVSGLTLGPGVGLIAKLGG